ncbi:SDR family NAD(P)-dependent oxidoreductase [Agrobacterium tumefaciens]|uniref:SDR family oxidoreductase n=1 Tax=Agrobacterium tumefaciens TaxID=358 RepID=UPI0012B6D0F7|nr:SDR family oxidoreductase [Agrobacterium tumefaciens]MQB07294.1 SDR family NAD(P)-dependent oxidoreductase [Agrobacterium tumefaciens]
MSLPLSRRIAVITGASSGIGEATARLLAERGAKVAVLARRADRLDALVGDIAKAGGTALAVPVDVTNQASVDAAAARVISDLGRPDLVFNNAGVMLPGPIEEKKLDETQHQIDLNISGLMRVIYAFVPSLVEAAAAGGKADLINTSSIAGQYIYPNFAVYSATKAYVSHLSRHLRVELGTKDVRVNILEPGIVATELQGHVTDKGALDWLAGAKETIEFLQPQDIAEIVAFTASLPRHVNLQQVTVLPTRQGM